jgi:hypothetical protein
MILDKIQINFISTMIIPRGTFALTQLIYKCYQWFYYWASWLTELNELAILTASINLLNYMLDKIKFHD